MPQYVTVGGDSSTDENTTQRVDHTGPHLTVEVDTEGR